MTATVAEQLHAFATSLLERRGALVDWPTADATGSAMLPPEVADAVGADGEIVSMACDAAGGGLSVNLAGDFLEWAGHLLDAVPRVGTFRLRDPYLKRKDLEQGIDRAFAWLNAKVRLRDARETTVEYHTWWFHAAMQSEDRWETSLRVSLNASSGVEVEIPDPLGLWDLEPRPASRSRPPSTYSRAAVLARRRLLGLATAFLDRMDARLGRDRKRLREYYRALVRESQKKKPRGCAQPDPEKTEATRRAVDLELRRKLAELDERYAVEAALRPVVVVRTETPVLAVDLSVFRKRAEKTHTVYWNPLVKQFDPLACGRCGDGTFAVTFENETVAPLCRRCAAAGAHRSVNSGSRTIAPP